MVTSQHMNETQTLKGAVVKTLAIVGFLVTVGFLIIITVVGAKRAPEGFSSLATLAESINLYNRPSTELSIATEKIVVNSSEPFQISWTDMHADGEYTFSYGCADGVSLSVRSADGSSVPMRCEEKLSLSKEANGLFLTALSDEMRFTDVTLTVSFKNAASDAVNENTTKITVVNATIPVQNTDTPKEEPVTETEPPLTENETTPEPVQPEPEVKPEVEPETPVVVPVTPTPKPAPVETGTPDLRISVLGNGVLTNGVFTYTQSFDPAKNNAIRFDVQNTGTKTSGAWSFKTIFPNGEVYTSPVQAGLTPQAHVVFTLGFYLDSVVGTETTFVTTVYPQGIDATASNNTASQSVVVE